MNIIFNKIKQIIFLILIVLLTSCVTTGEKQGESDQVSYNYFYTPADHIKKLLKSNQYLEASEVYNSQKAFFSEEKKENKPLSILAKELNKIQKTVLNEEKTDNNSLLDKLAEKLNEFFKPKLNQAITNLSAIKQNPKITSNWLSYRTELEVSMDLINNYEEHEILRQAEYRLNDINNLQNLKNEIVKLYQELSENIFFDFNHTEESSFFDSYPIKLDNKSIFLETIASQLTEMFKTYQVEELESFLAKYKNELTSEDAEKSVYISLSNIYVNKIKSQFKSGLKGYFNSVTQAKEHGFSPEVSTGIKIAVIDGSSQSLLTAGAIEFPVSLDIDFLANATKTTLQKALKENYDYILVFSVNVAKNTRRILKRDTISSKFVSGTREDPNPEYETAKMAAYQAQSEYNNENSRYCNGWGCVAKGLLVAAASGNLDKRKNILNSTPTTISKNIYQKYKYNKSNVTAKKFTAVKYYFLDLKSKKLHSGDFDVLEEQKFSIVYNLNEDDTEHATIINKNDTEEVITSFEDEEISVNLSDVVKQVLKEGGKLERLNSKYPYLKNKILADRHTTILKYNDDIEDTKLEKDKRMDHVVVVYNPTGSIGTGFYVKPDLILTNYHVIEDSKYVELKTNSGMESFGKIVKSDVRLDLALIKAQQRGKPVRLYKGSIKSGATVEALGHPKGLEFSITRGVVSAIRKRKSVFDVGGKDVLFIQTDTPINPGNSGGPLFFKDKVVGVNNNKLVDVKTEGIGFSIHYKEIEKFLNKEF